MKKNSEQLKNLPTLPGVYKFKNKDEKIIYIGKAKNLKNRIRSYFQNSKTQSSKTISMMKNADSFEWIIVKNEVEALLTEANLIKKHRPKYNILMKDDKTYQGKWTGGVGGPPSPSPGAARSHRRRRR